MVTNWSKGDPSVRTTFVNALLAIASDQRSGSGGGVGRAGRESEGLLIVSHDLSYEAQLRKKQEKRAGTYESDVIVGWKREKESARAKKGFKYRADGEFARVRAQVRTSESTTTRVKARVSASESSSYE